MLSLVICSRKFDISKELKQNIASTIGLALSRCTISGNKGLLDTCNCQNEYELIVINNSDNKYNIFSAYNEGVRRAKGCIICFMHEDVVFHSKNWGINVVKHFKEHSVGLVGVNGTHFMAKYASPWWSASMSSGQIIQGNIINGVYSTYEEQLWGRKGQSDSIEAVVVDGFWMCIRKSLFDNGIIRFDDKTFSGFHCYDTDICMQIINSGFEVRIIFDLLIEHNSIGSPDISYFACLDLWYAKWKNALPVYKGVYMSDLEILERDKICRSYSDLFRYNEILLDQISCVRNSLAYKIGSFIVKPLRFLKRYVVCL